MNHPSETGNTGTSEAAIESFVAAYPPSDVRPVGSAFLEYAAAHLPQTLVEVYRRFGLGWFGAQELELVDPGEWAPVLVTWLGPDAHAVAFAVTSFGHVYHLDAEGQVQCLDPHFLTNTVVASSVEEFLGSHVPSEGSHVRDLQGPREGAAAKLGALAPGELYFFDPMLPLGGQVSPNSLAKGNGVEHALRTHREVREQGAY